MLEDGLCRLYFSSRDQANRSHVGYAEFDVSTALPTLERVCQAPILAPGGLGEFDDHGVYAASLVKHDQQDMLYTIGWNPGAVPPLFYASIGLSTAPSGSAAFQKQARFPLLARGEHDPCLVTSPVVLKLQDGWKMWYVSGYRWDWIDGVPQSFYNVKYAESQDGIHWQRTGHVCIDQASANESNISRFWVCKGEDEYHGWFASHDIGEPYSIKYARSPDGKHWQRQPGFQLHTRGETWDSEAQAYPAVLVTTKRKLMFYNGNGFGKTGIGVAECLE